MLVNISNHPSITWKEDQIQAAQKQFGEIVDFPFPSIPPEWSLDEVRDLAQTIFSTIIHEYYKDNSNLAIHVMGEMTFCYHLIKLFENEAIPCYASTTVRNQDTIEYSFARYRLYFKTSNTSVSTILINHVNEVFEHKKMSFFSRLFKSIYDVKYNLLPFVFLLVLLSAIIAGLFGRLDIFSKFWDPLITLVTFSIAFFLGLMNIYKDWLNGLEKRLTAYYIFYFEDYNILKVSDQEFVMKNKLEPKTPYCLMVCQEAFLAHESDIRNWGQQIGRQLNRNNNLQLHLFFTSSPEKEVIKVYMNGKKHLTRQYIVKFYLKEVPEEIIRLNRGILSTDNYDNNPTSSEIEFKIQKMTEQKISNKISNQYISTLRDSKSDSTV